VSVAHPSPAIPFLVERRRVHLYKSPGPAAAPGAATLAAMLLHASAVAPCQNGQDDGGARAASVRRRRGLPARRVEVSWTAP